MNEPKNGLYLTSSDFENFQDSYADLTREEILYDDKGNLDNLQRVKNITFVVTERCNLNCTYCYEKHKTNKVMSKQVAKDGVDFILDKERINGYYDLDKTSAIILEFIGGEPLLEIDLIDYIVEYFKFKAFEIGHPWAINYMISMTTNGILYNTEKVQKFIKKNRNRVSISITIDGNKELHDSCRVFPDGKGSYDIVEKSIKQKLQNDNHSQTKITLSPYNIKYLNDAIRNVWNIGIHGAFANCVFEEGWKLEHAKTFYYELVKLADHILDNKLYNKYFTSLFDESIGKPLIETRNWCGGNGAMLAIGTDGKCYPCIRYMQYALSTEGRKEQSIGDIYKGMDSVEDNEWLCNLKCIDMKTQSDDKCNNCSIASGCAICSGYNYDKFGDANIRATFICIMHQARVLACKYYFSKLYKILNINKVFDLNIPKEWALNIIPEDEYLKLLKVGE
jgi:uncharacterized protein